MVSLGGRCETAYQLRNYNRSERAYPFDWWITPAHALPKLLKEGAASAFGVQHLGKLAAYEGKPALYSHFGGSLRRPGTVHPHEFPYEMDWLSMSIEDISTRLAEKYRALDRRLADDARNGRTLFVRQCLPGHDPDKPEELGLLIDELMQELHRLSNDFTLLLLDFAPMPPRPHVVQANVPPMRGVEGLGSVRAWRRMFREVGVQPGRGAKPIMPDIFGTLPPAGR